MDIVDSTTRSRMMSGIRGKNTKPEIIIRRLLHARGFRFRLHQKKLPGKPDLILPKYNAAIFIHGCFWHGHSCRYFKLPKTRTDFWLTKINNNKARDYINIEKLRKLNWRTLIIWECAIRKNKKSNYTDLTNKIESWISESSESTELNEFFETDHP